jgi:hypothetical protein
VDWELTGVLVGGVCVLAIYSFLYRENPFYRFFEHLFIGVSAGYGVVLTVAYFFWPDYIKPKFIQGLIDRPWEPYNWWNLLWVLPVLYGLLIYFMLSRRRAWLARLVIGIGLGVGGGLYFKGFFAQFLPDVVNSFRPLVALRPEPGGPTLDLWTMFENLFFMITLVCVMTYFFFSFEHDKPFIKQASITGRYLMMVTFGAFFGATVMARMALLIDRLQFLIDDWAAAVARLLGG